MIAVRNIIKLAFHRSLSSFSTSFPVFLPKTHDDDYQILSLLGKGSSSRVYLGMNVLTLQNCVIKIIKQERSIEQTETEIAANTKMVQSNYPVGCNFIQLIDVLRTYPNKAYCLIFNYHPGTTLNLLLSSLTTATTLSIMKQTLISMAYFHSLGFIHRDIKPANILITNNKEARIFDFGLAKEGRQPKIKNFGTKCYKTPQVVFRFKTGYDDKLDIWALGLTFAEMLLQKRHLLAYTSDQETLSQVASLCDLEREDQYLIMPELVPYIKKKKSLRWDIIANEKNVDPAAINLVKSMLQINPSKRPSAQQLLKNDLFKEIQ